MTPSQNEPSGHYLALVRSHLDKVIANGAALDYGPDPCPMWMASLDIRTGQYPADDRYPAHIQKRVYRNIGAPRGCTLYWDQPALVAAHALSRLSGDDRYSQAADAYVQAFLERCVARGGLFLWGNHYYYDAFRGQTVWFYEEEEARPYDPATEDGWRHETRPIPPAWDLFWRLSPEATERCIRQMGERHLFDRQSGGFNRHADGKREHAFLEFGGILAESLCWLARRTGDDSLAGLALRAARFSWDHRGPDTGLVENDPTTDRWDKFVCTTEVGLWAGSLLRAGDLSGLDAFYRMAEAASLAYLRYGFDQSAGRYYGRLRVKDGAPDLAEKTTLYQPDVYADIWNPLFPTHDYPLALAESCVSLYKRTGRPDFATGIRRWARIIQAKSPASNGQGAYAEHYGRAIHFLLGASAALDNPDYRAQAEQMAAEAGRVLFDHQMFRGHPGEERYDAVDGVGFLLLALLYLETGQAPDYMGFGF